MALPLLAYFWLTIAFCCLGATVAPFPQASSAPVVQLTSGTFRGIISRAPNNTDKWLGIPFAQPPVGNLRFKAPVAITNPPRGVQNATQFGDACPQRPSDSLGAPFSEDCLFLNVSLHLSNDCQSLICPQVWRPTGTTSKDKLPVLVWFYVRYLPLVKHTLITLCIGRSVHGRVQYFLSVLFLVYSRFSLQCGIKPVLRSHSYAHDIHLILPYEQLLCRYNQSQYQHIETHHLRLGVRTNDSGFFTLILIFSPTHASQQLSSEHFRLRE